MTSTAPSYGKPQDLPKVDPATYLPLSALRRLEPRPGGHWSVINEAQNTVTVLYAMDGGMESVSYDIQLCTSEGDIEAHCADFLYDFPSVIIPEGFGDQPVHGQNSWLATQDHQRRIDPTLQLVLSPEEHSTTPGGFMNGCQEVPASGAAFVHNTASSILHPGAVAHCLPSGSSLPGTQSMSHIANNHDQAGSQQTNLNSSTSPAPAYDQMQWSFAANSLSTASGLQGMLADDIKNLDDADLLSPTTWDGSWSTMTDVNDHGTNQLGSSTWDAMFSSA